MSDSSGQGYTYRQYLQFERHQGHGLYTEKPENFMGSIFCDNFYDAFACVGRFIRTLEALNKQPNASKDGSASKDSLEKIIPAEHLKDERFYNVIGFFGERGVGKTSVMHSFVRSLVDTQYSDFIKKYVSHFEMGSSGKDGKEETLETILEKYVYFPLQIIDVSLLEENESIVDIILTKMYEDFTQALDLTRQRNWRVNDDEVIMADDIRRSMANVYDGYHLIRDGKDKRETSKFSVEILKGLSDSFKVRQNIIRLINQFLTVIFKNAKNAFLVICIDDLDLSARGFEILEDLHRYFMIPNVIICVTANSKDLHRICIRHFDNTHGIGDKNAINDANEMAITYLEKVLPVDNRIHLHSLLDRNCYIKEDNRERTIKQYILQKIAERTRLFYDGAGLKKHFYELSNIRTLRNLNSTFNEMPLISNAPKAEEQNKTTQSTNGQNSSFVQQSVKYTQITTNLSKIHDDIVERMAKEKLSNEESKDVFKRFCNEDLARRGALLIDWILVIMGKGIFTDEYAKYGYNYGELLRAINLISTDKPEYKGLVHCILAECSVAMTRLYYTETMLGGIGEQEYEKRAKREWKQLIGKSVAGSYANKILPDIEKVENADDPESIDHNNGENEDKNVLHFGYEEKREFPSPKNITLAFREIPNGESVDEYIKWCGDLLNDESVGFANVFYYLNMFLSEIEYTEPSLKSLYLLDSASVVERTIADKEATKEHKGQIVLRLNVSKCNFDVFGFVVNTRDFNEYSKNIKDMLEIIFIDAGSRLFAGWGKEHYEKIRDIVQKIKFPDIEVTDLFDGKNYALPLHCVDIMYNIFKRLRRSMREKYGARVLYDVRKSEQSDGLDISVGVRKKMIIPTNATNVDNKDLHNIQTFVVNNRGMVKLIRSCFKEIEKELTAEDSFYTDSKGNKMSNMSILFNNHPLARYILDYGVGNPSTTNENLFADLLSAFVLPVEDVGSR